MGYNTGQQERERPGGTAESGRDKGNENRMKRWEKPEFEHVPLGAEVTAYMGSSRIPD